MSQTNEVTIEIRRLRRLLKRMYSLAEHSSLTGALSDGGVDAVAQYNLILTRLGELGILSQTLFPPLPPDASFDRLGVASKLLEGYLEEEVADSAPMGAGNHIHIGNIGDIGAMEELKDLGRLVRENLPEFLRKRGPAMGSEETVASDPEQTAPTVQAVDEAPRNTAPIPMPYLSR